jgi:hypothetical protein
VRIRYIEVVYYETTKRELKKDLYMSVGVMKDEKLKLRDLHVSHTLCGGGTGTPKDSCLLLIDKTRVT